MYFEVRQRRHSIIEATHGRFAPEEQKLLGSCHLIIINSDLPLACGVGGVMDDAGFEQDQGNR